RWSDARAKRERGSDRGDELSRPNFDPRGANGVRVVHVDHQRELTMPRKVGQPLAPIAIVSLLTPLSGAVGATGAQGATGAGSTGATGPSGGGGGGGVAVPFTFTTPTGAIGAI